MTRGADREDALAEGNRDESVERVLRQSMRERPMPAASDGCLDGETIAAWAERVLQPADAARVEQHLSDCARCSALLATFVRTAPEAAASEPLWSRWHLSWFVPLATAATATALWIAIPRNQPASVQPKSTEQVQTTREAPPTTPSSQPPPQIVAPDAAADKLATRTRGGLPSSKAESRAPEPTLDQRVDTLGREQSRPAEERQLDRVRSLADRDAPAPREVNGRLEQERSNAAKQSERAAAAATPAAPARSALSEAVGVRAAPARLMNAAAIVILSPTPANRWRITAEGQVQHSTDGGAQWEEVTIPSSVNLTSGSSPSSSTCWIVGRAGTIFLTTDGRRFARVPFPEVVDLIRVSASDDRNATVTAADGRTFRTNDQGATWSRK